MVENNIIIPDSIYIFRRCWVKYYGHMRLLSQNEWPERRGIFKSGLASKTPELRKPASLIEAVVPSFGDGLD